MDINKYELLKHLDLLIKFHRMAQKKELPSQCIPYDLTWTIEQECQEILRKLFRWQPCSQCHNWTAGNSSKDCKDHDYYVCRDCNKLNGFPQYPTCDDCFEKYEDKASIAFQSSLSTLDPKVIELLTKKVSWCQGRVIECLVPKEEIQHIPLLNKTKPEWMRIYKIYYNDRRDIVVVPEE